MWGKMKYNLILILCKILNFIIKNDFVRKMDYPSSKRVVEGSNPSGVTNSTTFDLTTIFHIIYFNLIQYFINLIPFNLKFGGKLGEEFILFNPIFYSKAIHSFSNLPQNILNLHYPFPFFKRRHCNA